MLWTLLYLILYFFVTASTEGRGAQLVAGRADPRCGATHTLSLSGLLYIRLWHQPWHPHRWRTYVQAVLTQRLLRLWHCQWQRWPGGDVWEPAGETKGNVFKEDFQIFASLPSSGSENRCMECKVQILTIECTYTCDDLDSCTLVFRCPSCLARWKCWWRRWSSSRNVMTKRKPVRRKWPLVLRGRRQRACWWSPRVSGFFLGLFQTMVQGWLVLKQHVWSTEDEECVPSRDISRHFEDPSYGYKDFYRRGEQVPTLRVQVRRKPHCFACCRW